MPLRSLLLLMEELPKLAQLRFEQCGGGRGWLERGLVDHLGRLLRRDDQQEQRCDRRTRDEVHEHRL